MKKITWSELREGDLVFEKGQMNGKPFYYGPFTVMDVQRRLLKNKSIDRTFVYYPDLYQKEENETENYGLIGKEGKGIIM